MLVYFRKRASSQPGQIVTLRSFKRIAMITEYFIQSLDEIYLFSIYKS